ncbi:uncharacterized protein LOC135400814 [Ornithodoros turicata]|uniref:uncharacterized protein LOC135400814 n=1 Tax=Ornithodoros turicata TaxID=34597 RepID=UPI003139FFC5
MSGCCTTKMIVTSGVPLASAPETSNVVEAPCQVVKQPTSSTCIQTAHLKEPGNVDPSATPLHCLPGNKASGSSSHGRPLSEHVKGRVECSAKWCRNRAASSACSFFRFPKDERRFKWLHYANRPDLEGLPPEKLHERRLCSAHFTTDAFSSRHRVWLKKTACPSVIVTDPVMKYLVPEEFFCPKEGPSTCTTESTASSSQTSPCNPVEKMPSSVMPSLEGDAVHDKSQLGNAGNTEPVSSEQPPSKKAQETATTKSFIPIAMKKPTVAIPPNTTLNSDENLPVPITAPPEPEPLQKLMPLTSMEQVPVAPGIVYYRLRERGTACDAEIDVHEGAGPLETGERSMDTEDTQYYYADSPGSLYSSVVETSAATVALQTEESNMERSSFNVLFCCCNSEGANTQISHKPVDTKLSKWTISYIKYS